MAPFAGKYKKSPQTKTEHGFNYYVDFSGKYAVWFSGDGWWIGNYQDKGTSNGFAVLREVLTYPVNHEGWEIAESVNQEGWEIAVPMAQVAKVGIKCASE